MPFKLSHLSVILSVLAGCNMAEIQKRSLTNPIIDSYLADPFVIREDGCYYLFSSHQAADQNFIPIHRSRDLTAWEFVRGAVTNGDTADWNYKHFWAPEVIKIEDTFYLYYTASKKHSHRNKHNRVGVATSNNIEGPYQDYGVVIPHGSIDGHPYFDEQGQMYMYFTTEQLNHTGLPMGKIYVHKMKDPFTVDGDPQLLIGQFPWQEGAFIVPKDHEYWMTFSSGAWKDSTYHVRLAKSNSPVGPFQVLEDTLIKSNNMVWGPGHNSVFYDESDNPWLAYHGWDTAYTARYTRLDPMYWQDGMLKCDGPSYQAIEF